MERGSFKARDLEAEMCTVPCGGGPLARLRPPSCPQVRGHLKQPQNNRIHQHPFHFQSPLLQDPVGYQGEHRRSETEAKVPAHHWGGSDWRLNPP